MKVESLSSPMELSDHQIYHRLFPDTYTWANLYGKIFLKWKGTTAQLFVTEPELIKEIMTDKDGWYLKQKLSGHAKKLLGDGMMVSQGEKWSTVRKIANHAFHGESLKGMIPEMISSAEIMLERWEHHEGKEMEVYAEFRLLTQEVISRTAFGSSYLEGKHIFDMITKMGTIVYRNLFNVDIPGFGKILKSRDDIESDKIEKEIRDSIIGIINRRKKKVMRGEEENYGNDFLGLLMQANHDADSSSIISVHNIIDECKIFYFAGQETTNSLLAWTIFLLATHPDWQDEARKEVLDSFGHENPNPEGLARLKNISMILNETLRLYFPGINLTRRVEKEVRLGKLVIPANTELHLSPMAHHHDPEIWGPDTHLFKPERFEEGVAKATKNNILAFIPFGFGPRICVGSNFATTEAKIALSMILQRYEFKLSPSYVHSPYMLLAVKPRHGIPVILRKELD
ncbi:11-oxo-beta-amyrin 30-oxidase [Bertholletia excelsa]